MPVGGEAGGTTIIVSAILMLTVVESVSGGFDESVAVTVKE
jgi:hypothetical protein